MRSSEQARSIRCIALALPVALVAVAWATDARAQHAPQPVEGYGIERLYLSPPGAGWFVMDTLDMRGGLGGVASLTLGYAHDPLRIRSSDGSRQLAVVSDQAFANFGFAATYDRWRLYLDFNMPLLGEGESGGVGKYQFTSPCTPSGTTCTPDITLGNNPDLLSDVGVGADVRLFGDAASAFRFGADARLFVPNGDRAEYVTDGSYRAMGRLLMAGDTAAWTYAAQLGVHVRPLDDSPAPGSPQGSELLFGAAGGARVTVSKGTALIAGPELFGATAFHSLLGSSGTALEAMMTGRLEGTRDDEPQLRLKVGVGAGLDARFGAPAWRAAVSIELFDHHVERGLPRSSAPAPATVSARGRAPARSDPAERTR